MKALNQLNEFNVPLHACCGYVQDEHYWAWVHFLNTIDEDNDAPYGTARANHAKADN